MSASIYWTGPERRKLLKGLMAPSRFIESMEGTFGSFPLRLDKSNIDMLRAMATVWGEKDESNPYSELVKILTDKADMIELTIEY